MISVSRKTHIPSVAESNCCAMSSKWCRSSGWCSAAAACVSANLHLLLVRIRVSVFGHDGRLVEIEGGRRGRGLPLESLGAPWIVRGTRAVPHGPQQIDQRNQVAQTQNGRTRGGQHV